VNACADNTSTLAGYLGTLCYELRKPHESCQGISLFYNLFTCTEHTMYMSSLLYFQNDLFLKFLLVYSLHSFIKHPAFVVLQLPTYYFLLLFLYTFFL